MRTVNEILRDHRLTMADLVKAARLNQEHARKVRPHDPNTFEAAARSIAECLTADAGEVRSLISAMQGSK